LTVQALADKPAAAAEKPEAKPQAAAAADDVKAEKKPEPPAIHGVVSSVDAGNNTITLRYALGDGSETKKPTTKEETFPVAKDAKVLLLDLLSFDKSKEQPLPEGKLADLLPDTFLHVQLTEDKKTIVGIRARGPSIAGTVSSVDAGKNTLTLSVTVLKDGNKENEDRILEMMEGAKILLNDGLGSKEAPVPDQEGKLGNLDAGTPVHVQLTVDQKRVLGIRINGVTIDGTLKGYDAGNSQITITVKEDGNLVDKSFSLIKNATVVDLTEGAAVRLRFSVIEKGKVVVAQGLKD
jgi:hypothetical protein